MDLRVSGARILPGTVSTALGKDRTSTGTGHVDAFLAPVPALARIRTHEQPFVLARGGEVGVAGGSEYAALQHVWSWNVRTAASCASLRIGPTAVHAAAVVVEDLRALGVCHQNLQGA